MLTAAADFSDLGYIRLARARGRRWRTQRLQSEKGPRNARAAAPSGYRPFPSRCPLILLCIGARGRSPLRLVICQHLYTLGRLKLSRYKLIPISWTAKRQGKLPHKTIGGGGSFMSPAKAVAAAVDRTAPTRSTSFRSFAKRKRRSGGSPARRRSRSRVGSTFPSPGSKRL